MAGDITELLTAWFSCDSIRPCRLEPSRSCQRDRKGENGLVVPSVSSSEPATDQLDIGRLSAVLRRHRLAGLITLALALIGASIFLNMATYKHEALVVLVPADQSTRFSGEGLANLSAIVGMELGPQSRSEFALFREAAESLDVAAALARDERIVGTVFSHLRDPDTGRWQEPSSLWATISAAGRRLSGAPLRQFRPPGAEEIQTYLRRHVSIAPDRRRMVTTVRYLHQDPDFARYLVDRLVKEADSFLRKKSLERSRKYIAYLESRLAEIQIAEQRSALTQSLSTFEMKQMMASADLPFAAEPFGRIIVSVDPIYPKPVIVYLSSILLALGGWGVYVLAKEQLAAPKKVSLREENTAISA